VLDAANISDHIPALTTTLRGNLIVRVDVRTLVRPVHSGGSGGVLPDAIAVASRIIAGLYDERGAYRITPDPVGVLRQPVPESLSANVFVPLHGRTRPIEFADPVGASWYSYSATVTGMDVTAIDAASNTLLDTVSFRLSIRIPPGSSAAVALEDLGRYLNADTWSGSEVAMEVESQSEPYAADPTTMRARLLQATITSIWGDEPKLIGIGASIPIVAMLSESMPGCETLLFGVGSSSSRVHSTDESLDIGLLDRIALTLAHYLQARISEVNPTRGTEKEVKW
jgi:acetylornithine deacetylase/succinyl-diaminopimelate desuccinylase-like protein